LAPAHSLQTLKLTQGPIKPSLQSAFVPEQLFGFRPLGYTGSENLQALSLRFNRGLGSQTFQTADFNFDSFQGSVPIPVENLKAYSPEKA